MTPRQKAQEIVDDFCNIKDRYNHDYEKLESTIEEALLDAAKVELGKRCPCGGIILADTDECKVPVCIECCIEISKSYLNMDENYNEGFKRGQEAERTRVSREG